MTTNESSQSPFGQAHAIVTGLNPAQAQQPYTHEYHPETTTAVPNSSPALVALSPIAESVHEHDDPEPTPEHIMRVLLTSADVISISQTLFDMADRAYQTRLATVSLIALSSPFPGTDKPASNDKARELMITNAINQDSALVELVRDRENALRDLIHAKNEQENARIIAGLLTKLSK